MKEVLKGMALGVMLLIILGAAAYTTHTGRGVINAVLHVGGE